jgi:hypothetical protein
MPKIPTLVGIAGHFVGEQFPLEYGRKITVGRSREASFSLRRAAAYRAQSKTERETDAAAKTVSGKHFEITMYNLSSIEIKNLSPNGTWLDNKPIQALVIKDIAKKTYELRFGADERMKLELRDHEEA